MLIGRATIIGIGALVTVTAFNPPALIGDLAAQYGARLHALYVVDIDAVNFGLGTEQVDRIKQGNFGEMTELKEEADDATGAVVAYFGFFRSLEAVRAES